MANEPKRIWDNHKEIGEVVKAKKTKIIVSLTATKGVKYINIREWYQKRNEEIWRPGINGISIPIQSPVEGQIEEVAYNLIKVMAATIVESKDFPLEGNIIYVKEKTE